MALGPRHHDHGRVLAACSFTTLPDEPGTAVALIVIVVLSIVVDLVWKRIRSARILDHAETADGRNGAVDHDHDRTG